MIEIEVEPNPNCAGTDYQVFQEMGPAKRVKKMCLTIGGQETWYEITGLEAGGGPCPAYAQKVADSGGGVSFLIYGGRWGIRFRPEGCSEDPWDLANPSQWGEPFKFYGAEEDILYEE